MTTKYDVLIKSAPKDYQKLGLVINSIKFLNPQPSKIFLINPHGYRPEKTDFDNKIVNVKDATVFPNCDRNNISHRKNWCYATFIALFQDITEQDYYLDIQSDNFFLNPVDLFTDDKPTFFMSPQHSHYHQPYFNFSKKMFDLERVGDDSFIIDFMMYKKSISKEMLRPYGTFDEFFKLACKNINGTSYPTEQDSYANWCLKHHKGLYHIKKNIQTILRGKNYPSNYTEDEIKSIINMYLGGSTSISLHTWQTKEQ